MSIALIVCIVGALIYLIASLVEEGKITAICAELGRLAFAVGLLAYLLK